MKKKQIMILLLILLLFLCVVYFFKNSEGMCSVEINEMNDENIVVYYGEFGSVTVKTMENGDRIIVGVKRNDSFDDSVNTFQLYGPEEDTIIVHKTEDGLYVLVSDESAKEEEESSIVTYYGNYGSVTVETNSDGSKTILEYNVTYSNESHSVSTFYGPNGNSIDVVRTPDGTVRIVSDNTTKDVITINPKNNFIRKTEIVPPVCPVCPSITSCEKVSQSSESSKDGKKTTIEGPNGGKITQDEDGNIDAVGPRGGTATVSSNGNAAIQTAQGTTVIKTENGMVAMNDQNGNVVAKGPQGNMVASNGKIGMYLGDNTMINEPMPVLNNFSSFGS